MSQNSIVEKKRDKSYDLLKLFAIYLVLLGHCFEHFVPTYGSCFGKPVFTYIYSVHMPLFAVVSGFFAYKNINDMPFKKIFTLIKKKFFQLVFPCLTMGVFLVIVECAIATKTREDLSVIDVVARYVSCFWFLKALFVCFILGFITNKLLKIRVIWAGLFVVVSILCLTKFSLLFIFPSFLFGMWLYKRENKWCNHLKFFALISGIVFVTLLCFWKKPFYPFVDVGLILSGNLKIILETLGLQMYRLSVGFIGSFFLIAIFKLIFNQRSEDAIGKISAMGKHTLGVYILQCIILEDLLPIWFHLPSDSILCQLMLFPISLIILLVLTKTVLMIQKKHIVKIIVLGK